MSGFRVPTRVHVEPGCVRAAGPACAELGARRVFLVHDPGLSGSAGLAALLETLHAAALECVLSAALESNPRVRSVDALGRAARAERCDLVIGLGGGSALDAGKAAALMATNPGSVSDYVGRNRYPQRPLPFVAIPTTCGTGSEVSWVAVLSQPETSLKISVKGESMFPALALVDADLLASLPPRIVAWTALDALTHALEAYTCRLANPLSDVAAERAVELIWRYLRRGFADIGHDAQAREGLMLAATLAGLAFSNADVGGVHCLSETLGGRFDVPHGMANAMLLVPVLRYHLPFVGGKLEGLAARLGLRAPAAFGAAALLEDVARLVADVGIPEAASLGLGREHLAWIAEQAAANNSNAANPQVMTPANYLEILAAL